MDALLDHLVQTTDIRELRSFLDDRLHEELPGKESRAKAAGILLRVWGSVPEKHLSLRQQAIALLPHITGQERIWLHWGMSVLEYPFFRDVAEVVGRILMLQDDFTGAQVQARLLTAWGDRSTTREATQKLLTTFVDWGVLRSAKTQGRFLLAGKWTTSHTELQLWLLEALLAASSAGEIEAQQLLRIPESFPFTLGIGVGELRKHPRFSIHRQGLDMDMVSWRMETSQLQPKPARRKSTKAKKPIPVQPSLFDGQQLDSVLGNRESPPQEEKLVASPPPESISPREPLTESQSEPRSVEEQRALDNPLAAPAQECAKQFQDGYYYGCIALSYAIVEAIVQHVWQVKLNKKKSQKSDFKKNVEALYKKGFLCDELKTSLDQSWVHRYSFHHLKPAAERGDNKLETLAQNNLQLLSELEQLFFSSSVNDGVLIPRHPGLGSTLEKRNEACVEGQKDKQYDQDKPSLQGEKKAWTPVLEFLK
jgi:hypothetical protein